MYQAKSGVKKFSLYCGGGSLDKKFFFSSLNMYQAKSGVKKFSLYWGGGSLDKKIFFQSEHVSSQIWCQKFFPLLRPGPLPPPPTPIQGWMSLPENLIPGTPLPPSPPHPRLDQPTRKSETWDPALFPPPIQGWISLPENLRPGSPPLPRNVNRLKLLPFPILRMAGGRKRLQ